MDIEYPGFGVIVVEGVRYEHDVVLHRGLPRERDKAPSRNHPSGRGHTPLTAAEDIPWDLPRLFIGSGYSGRLPIVPEVEAEANRRGVELVVVPTVEVCEQLRSRSLDDVNAILHVTC